jgi:sugar lactone lactonase YvrE
VSFRAADRVIVIVPGELEGGEMPIRFDDGPGETAFVAIGKVWATGLHQVDSPVFDAGGTLYVTYSGSRGQEAPISIFRVTRHGTREPFASGIVNATSMAIGPDGALYVSSRFEGAVHRVNGDGSHEVIAGDLGVPCGLAFDEDGWMYVGDRSGTIFRVRDGKTLTFATLPPSVAAFHLAMSPVGELHVAAPTLAPYDRIFRLTRNGDVTALPYVFGRPQGLAFDRDGVLHVADALAGASGVYRIRPGRPPELVICGAAVVGIAFGPRGEVIASSNETAYGF